MLRFQVRGSEGPREYSKCIRYRPPSLDPTREGVELAQFDRKRLRVKDNIEGAKRIDRLASAPHPAFELEERFVGQKYTKHFVFRPSQDRASPTQPIPKRTRTVGKRRTRRLLNEPKARSEERRVGK